MGGRDDIEGSRQSIATDAAAEKNGPDIDRRYSRKAENGVARIARIVQSIQAFSRPGREEKGASDINQGLPEMLTIATKEIKHVATVEIEAVVEDAGLAAGDSH